MNDRLHEMQRKNTHVTNYQINRNASLLECSVFENEIGIHTIEFHYGVPAQGNELFLIWNVLKSGERYPKRFSMACLIPGLFAEMLGHEYYPVLKMLVNPRVMANGRDGYLGITSYDADTLQQCRTIFDRFWQQKGIGIRMNTCTIARVDLCVNLELSEWFPIPQYLNLLKRSPRKKSFILQHYDDAVMDGHQFKIVNQKVRMDSEAAFCMAPFSAEPAKPVRPPTTAELPVFCATSTKASSGGFSPFVTATRLLIIEMHPAKAAETAAA